MTKAVKTKRVLVVDDEENILDLLSEVLGEEGYQVDGVTSGPDALKEVKNKSFDVMLVDLKLSKMDGMELLRLVKMIEPQLPVIVMSGNVNLQLVIESMRQGADDYITKPFKLEETVAAVNRGWMRRELGIQNRLLSDNSGKRSLKFRLYRE